MVKNSAYQKALKRIEQAYSINSTSLYLGDMGLREIPEEVTRLTNLRSLYLFGNKLKDIPKVLSHFTNLRTLHLSDNELTEFPEVIVQLTNLQTLWLNHNNLSEIPETITQLLNLRSLYLSSNKLKLLPKTFVQLQRLQTLRLNNNKFTEIPETVLQLKSLKTLRLNNNRLTQIPKIISQLKNLRILDFSHNKITQIPKEIAQLKNLIILYLDGNKLKTLPENLGELKQLEQLLLLDNPLPIPEEIIRRGWGQKSDKKGNPQIIIDYYLDYLMAGRQSLNEAKVILVGQGNVGKTSLVKRLCQTSFDDDECKTDGIEISNIILDIQIDDHEPQDVRLNIWDFGGQEIMHATHQFFLTKRSLYLLVLNNRSTEEENRLEYWLNTIESFGSDSPIIVVGNKLDEHPRDLNEKYLREKYPNIKAFVSTSCVDNIGIEELLNLIRQEISQLPHVSDVLPKPWFEIKERLENLKKNYIPYEEYATICNENEVLDCDKQKVLVSLLHDLGIVLNFHDDPNVSDTNVINPEWLTSGIYKIINHPELTTKYKGILSYSLLAEILPQNNYPTHKHKFIIAMMKKFELCLELDDKTVLIPNLLPKSAPEFLDETKWDGALRFEYHYPILAQSVISRFIVKMHDFIQDKTWWRTGVVLKDGNNEALVKADLYDKKIFIAVNGTPPTRRDFLAKICGYFIPIHQSFSEKSQPKEKVPLPNNNKVVVSYQHLLKLEHKGRDEYFPEDADEPISVSELLGSIRPSRLNVKELNDKTEMHFHAPVTLDMSKVDQSSSKFGVGMMEDGAIADNARVSGQSNGDT